MEGRRHASDRFCAVEFTEKARMARPSVDYQTAYVDSHGVHAAPGQPTKLLHDLFPPVIASVSTCGVPARPGLIRFTGPRHRLKACLI